MLDHIRQLLTGQSLEVGPLPDITFSPIGVIRNRISQPVPHGWENTTSYILLYPDLADTLLGLDSYSHLLVLFWMHQIPENILGSKLRLHPMDNTQLPLQGILATRSQMRSNPIGVTVVPLLGIKDTVIRVRGLDAIDGTPVIDIKPYIPHYDAMSEARVPGWVEGICRTETQT